jgi:hypothetical protein
MDAAIRQSGIDTIGNYLQIRVGRPQKYSFSAATSEQRRGSALRRSI